MDTTRLDRLKERFLLAAAKGGRLDEVVSLLEIGADLENCLFGERVGQDEEGEEDDGIVEEGNDTPLIAAARAGHAEIVSVLLANGANPNSKIERGDYCALHAAAEQGNVEVYCLLVAHGALEQLENHEGLTARQVAQRNGHLRRILRGLRKAEGKDDFSQTDGSSSQCTAELNEGEGEDEDEDEDEDSNENDDLAIENGYLDSPSLSVDSRERDDVEEEHDIDYDEESSCSGEYDHSDSCETSDDSSRTSAASDRAMSGAPTDVIVVGMSQGDPSRTGLSRTGQDDAREVTADLYLSEGVERDDDNERGGHPSVLDENADEDGVRTLRQRLALLRRQRDASARQESQESTHGGNAQLSVSDNDYTNALSNVDSLRRVNAVLEEEKRLLVDKLMRLKRDLGVTTWQKEMALEYCQVAKIKLCQARKDKEDALVRAQATESNQFERLFGIGTDCDTLSSSISLEELDSMEMKLKGALVAVAEAKETHLRKRLEQQDTEKACVICLEDPKTVLLLPCSHLCVCSNCSERAELVNCPLCRNTIDSMIKTFA